METNIHIEPGRRGQERYPRHVGDNACWLDQTCLSCGRFLDLDDTDDGCCPHCGAELPPAADDPAFDPPAR
jgi:predicted amidophosphoribosyltransferase